MSPGIRPSLTIAWATDEDQGDPREQTTTYEHDPSWAAEIDDFADAIAKNRAIEEGSSMDALRTMQLVYRIYCADEDWKAVAPADAGVIVERGVDSSPMKISTDVTSRSSVARNSTMKFE